MPPAMKSTNRPERRERRKFRLHLSGRDRLRGRENDERVLPPISPTGFAPRCGAPLQAVGERRAEARRGRAGEKVAQIGVTC